MTSPAQKSAIGVNLSKKRSTNYYLKITEKYGITGSRNTFIKPKNDNKLLRVSEIKIEKNSNLYILIKFFRQLFLPQGYPRTVSGDYFQYQFYDTIQAFASRITGTIATKSILESVGVGDAEATALAATVTWILKDGVGMVGSILFAWWRGTEFDSNCKKWRLFADILNDCAMTIELLTPYFSSVSVIMLCVTTTMKAAVGVAGGATRAAVTQHQALVGNAADVAAKDGSQETAVNLAASIAGLVLITLFHNSRFEWTIFILFVGLHLFANFLAVSSLVFRTLNESRYVIILRSYFRYDNIPQPLNVNRCESVFFFGLLTGKFGQTSRDLCGFDIKLGVSFRHITTMYNYRDVEELLNAYKNKMYLITPDIHKRVIHVVFVGGSDETPTTILEAYFHAVLFGIALHIVNNKPLNSLKSITQDSILTRLRDRIQTLQPNADIVKLCHSLVQFVDEEESIFLYELERQDWKTNLHSLIVDDWRLEQFLYE